MFPLHISMINSSRSGIFLSTLVGAILLISACTTAGDSASSPQLAPSRETGEALTTGEQIDPQPTQSSLPSPFPHSAELNRRVDDPEEYNVPQFLPFDAIPPIYNPDFLPADEAPLLDDELVMGVVIEGKAKAYPVSVLRFREMVDDELAGWPILVTW